MHAARILFFFTLSLLIIEGVSCSRAEDSSNEGAGLTPALNSAKKKDHHTEQREEMVRWQLATPQDGRQPVTDPLVLDALRAVPRQEFVPQRLRKFSYSDGPLPIGKEQTISQPYIVGLMTELLALKQDSKVLELGTGSGYQAAVLAEITPHVFGVEIIGALAQRAKNTLRRLGYDSVQIRHGDGFFGWPEEAPFDAIILTFAAEEIPDPLWQQLKDGGRLVIPLGPMNRVQELKVLTKLAGGKKEERFVTAVRFVPMLRGDH